MTILPTIANFLKGTYAKFGTSGNLVREISVSVITAVAVAVLVQLLTPSAPDPVSQLKYVLDRQHEADSIRFSQPLFVRQKSTGGLSTAPESSNGISSKGR